MNRPEGRVPSAAVSLYLSMRSARPSKQRHGRPREVASPTSVDARDATMSTTTTTTSVSSWKQLWTTEIGILSRILRSAERPRLYRHHRWYQASCRAARVAAALSAMSSDTAESRCRRPRRELVMMMNRRLSIAGRHLLAEAKSIRVDTVAVSLCLLAACARLHHLLPLISDASDDPPPRDGVAPSPPPPEAVPTLNLERALVGRVVTARQKRLRDNIGDPSDSDDDSGVDAFFSDPSLSTPSAVGVSGSQRGLRRRLTVRDVTRPRHRGERGEDAADHGPVNLASALGRAIDELASAI
mgnify:CR=1 FL=1